MSIFAFFHSPHDLHQLKKRLFPAAEQCGQKYALYHVTKQQNILYYARMALCRPGAFLSLWSRNIGVSMARTLSPGAVLRRPIQIFPKKSEWRKADGSYHQL